MAILECSEGLDLQYVPFVRFENPTEFETMRTTFRSNMEWHILSCMDGSLNAATTWPFFMTFPCFDEFSSEFMLLTKNVDKNWANEMAQALRIFLGGILGTLVHEATLRERVMDPGVVKDCVVYEFNQFCSPIFNALVLWTTPRPEAFFYCDRTSGPQRKDLLLLQGYSDHQPLVPYADLEHYMQLTRTFNNDLCEHMQTLFLRSFECWNLFPHSIDFPSHASVYRSFLSLVKHREPAWVYSVASGICMLLNACLDALVCSSALQNLTPDPRLMQTCLSAQFTATMQPLFSSLMIHNFRTEPSMSHGVLVLPSENTPWHTIFEARLALAMGTHPSLGEKSRFSEIDPGIVRMIGCMLFKHCGPSQRKIPLNMIFPRLDPGFARAALT